MLSEEKEVRDAQTLNALPKRVQLTAKRTLQAIWQTNLQVADPHAVTESVFHLLYAELMHRAQYVIRRLAQSIIVESSEH